MGGERRLTGIHRGQCRPRDVARPLTRTSHPNSWRFIDLQITPPTATCLREFRRPGRLTGCPMGSALLPHACSSLYPESFRGKVSIGSSRLFLARPPLVGGTIT